MEGPLRRQKGQEEDQANGLGIDSFLDGGTLTAALRRQLVPLGIIPSIRRGCHKNPWRPPCAPADRRTASAGAGLLGGRAVWIREPFAEELSMRRREEDR